MKITKKFGRPARFVKDSDGADIKGLSCSGGRYYATYSKPRVWFGNDETEAIRRFHEWQAKQDKPTIRLPVSDVLTVPELKERMKKGKTFNATESGFIEIQNVPENLLYAWMADQLVNHQKLAAQKTGIKEILNLHALTPPQKSLTLAYIGEFTKNKVYENKDEHKRNEKAWQEFCKAVGVSKVEDVTELLLAKFHKSVQAQKLSKKTQSNLYNRIATILQYAADNHKANRTELESLKTDFRNICKVGKMKYVTKANPIAVDDFAYLYQTATDEKFRAIALCMLNFAMHPKEITDIRKSDINLKTLELSGYREKTGEQRVAMIWQETANAIKAYQATMAGVKEYEDSEFLFVTRDNKPYANGALTKYFADSWRPAIEKLSGHKVKFTLDSVRDGSQNAADSGGADSINTEMLMGHTLKGSMGSYKLVTPAKTAKSVACIYDHYKIAELVK